MNNIDSILHKVQKPARYTGGEWNSIIKDWDKTPVRIALSYPDVYEIGMSNMALPILYDLLNAQPDVLAERVFPPWVDMAEEMKANGIPLFSLETKHPLQEFDVIGFLAGTRNDLYQCPGDASPLTNTGVWRRKEMILIRWLLPAAPVFSTPNRLLIFSTSLSSGTGKK